MILDIKEFTIEDESNILINHKVLWKALSTDLPKSSFIDTWENLDSEIGGKNGKQ